MCASNQLCLISLLRSFFFFFSRSVQGIIHSTRLALSPVGTQADVDLVRNLYEEPWWLQALADKDLLSFGKKLFFRCAMTMGALWRRHRGGQATLD